MAARPPTVRCVRCNAVVFAEDNFCGMCGVPLRGTSAPAAEPATQVMPLRSSAQPKRLAEGFGAMEDQLQFSGIASTIGDWTQKRSRKSETAEEFQTPPKRFCTEDAWALSRQGATRVRGFLDSLFCQKRLPTPPLELPLAHQPNALSLKTLKCAKRKGLQEQCPVTLDLNELRDEVRALRIQPPPYVNYVGELQEPNAICDDSGRVVRPVPGEGPWDLQVRVSGRFGDEVYGMPYRFRLRFDRHLWPNSVRGIHIQSIIHHALTAPGGKAMREAFYKTLPRDDGGQLTVAGIVQHLHDFLAEPKATLGLKEPFWDELVGKHREFNKERWDVIDSYVPRAAHPHLFSSPPVWRDEWFDPTFLRALRSGFQGDCRAIFKELLPGQLYSFPLFTEHFCQMLVDEVNKFSASGLRAQRPNNMNRYGLVLNEIGLEPLMDKLQEILQPVGEILFPGPGHMWDEHHSFIVRYKEGEDLGLDMHTDNAEVAFNICLGLEFDGAGLQFCGTLGAPGHRKRSLLYNHVKGTCAVHLGKLRHGADDIKSGERLNLILWNQSSTWRQSLEFKEPPYSKEAGPPDLECVSYTHDRDFGQFKEFPQGKQDHKGNGWCPKESFEYDGFRADIKD